MCKYRFSPSTLDKFTKVLAADAEFESPFNYSDANGYKLTVEEIRSMREQELLDSINKVPFTPTFEIARGTAFNELVDAYIRQVNSQSDSLFSHNEEVIFEEINTDTAIVTIADEAKTYSFTVVFSMELVEKVGNKLLDGTMQLHVQAPIDTYLGKVLLHGYPDYIQPMQVTDLKTTKNYTFGNYEKYWQRYTYPYILQKSGLMQRCDSFDFLVVEFNDTAYKKTGVLDGDVYTETYTNVDLPNCERELQWVCEGLITWIEAHKDQITNRKIFCE